MNIGEFKNLIKGQPMNAEIKMSNLNEQGVKEYPESGNPGYFDYSSSDGFAFYTDLFDRNHSTLGDFYKVVEDNNLSDDEEIICWDNDDGNIINFENVNIFKNSITLF